MTQETSRAHSPRHGQASGLCHSPRGLLEIAGHPGHGGGNISFWFRLRSLRDLLSRHSAWRIVVGHLGLFCSSTCAWKLPRSHWLFNVRLRFWQTNRFAVGSCLLQPLGRPTCGHSHRSSPPPFAALRVLARPDHFPSTPLSFAPSAPLWPVYSYLRLLLRRRPLLPGILSRRRRSSLLGASLHFSVVVSLSFADVLGFLLDADHARRIVRCPANAEPNSHFCLTITPLSPLFSKCPY
jgi:hypothetical protein